MPPPAAKSTLNPTESDALACAEFNVRLITSSLRPTAFYLLKNITLRAPFFFSRQIFPFTEPSPPATPYFFIAHLFFAAAAAEPRPQTPRRYHCATSAVTRPSNGLLKLPGLAVYSAVAPLSLADRVRLPLAARTSSASICALAMTVSSTSFEGGMERRTLLLWRYGLLALNEERPYAFRAVLASFGGRNSSHLQGETDVTLLFSVGQIARGECRELRKAGWAG